MSNSQEIFSKENKQYKDFLLEKLEPLDELDATLYEITHLPSKAKIIHIKNDDLENVFCLSFRTLPEDSTGVAHILEHTVLCGSKKFPVKDPFFSMNRRSLNTYMNALTGPDFTCYPAASQVEKDFYNLLDVYLDATFNPLLNKLSFLQEGHRLEFSKMDDLSTPLIFKGIVFNEMKGALASPISRLWEAIMQSLFPNILYHHNFGGDPKVITTLSYEELISFHEKYYEPSRCTFFFYGNLPTKKHLDFLLENTLKDAKALPKLKPNPTEPPFEKPKTFEFSYSVSDSEDLKKKNYFSLSWLTCPLTDQLEVLALHIVDLILMGTDAALLKMTLLKSSLCQSAFSNLEDELSQVPYSLIFEGCETNGFQKIEELTLQTLEEIVKKPIDTELIEAALHQLEFSRTEISSDYGPFGLSLILKSVPIENIGGKIEHNLKIHSRFKELKTLLNDPNYLPSLIKKHFIDNPHRVSIKLLPDPELSLKDEKEERQHLDQIEKKLSLETKEFIVKNSISLKEFQNEQEHQNIDVLPKVNLKDVQPEPRQLKLIKKKIKDANVYYHPHFTNKVIYLDLAFKLPLIDFEDLSYVKLFSVLLSHIGSADRSYQDNLKRIQSHTGGISSYIDVHVSSDNIDDFSPLFVIQGKALEHKVEHLIDILADMISSPSFDDQLRIEELISQHYIDLDQDVKHNSLKYANNLSQSSLYKRNTLSYYLSGLGYYYLVKKIIQNPKQELPKLIEKLNELKSKILHAHDYDLICSCDEEDFKKLEKISFGRLSELTPTSFTPWSAEFSLMKAESQARIAPSSVFFTAMTLKTVPFSHPQSPYLSIASRLFDNIVLHKLIREQGGAYGGGSSNRMNLGYFTFYSYRDPNLATTLQAFKKAVNEIAEEKFSERELEEAKLGIIQKLDHPISPEYRGLAVYTWEKENKSYEIRKKLRQTILNAKSSDIIQAIKELLMPQLEHSITATFGPKSLLEKENQKLLEQNLIQLKLLDI